MPQLGDQAPDFEADTTAGRIRFHEWLAGDWAVLVSHVTDFAAVCTGELHRLAALASEFEQRGCKLLGLSTDPLECHRRWEDAERASLGFPLVADPHGVVAVSTG
jgi:thioredoxin-dependent peroxiredoxin